MQKTILFFAMILCISNIACASSDEPNNKPRLTQAEVQIKVNAKLQDKGYDLSKLKFDDANFNNKTNIWTFLYWIKGGPHEVKGLIVTVSNDAEPIIKILLEDQ